MPDPTPTAALPTDVREAFASAAVTAIHELTQFDASADEPFSEVPPLSRGSIGAEMCLQRPIPGTLTLLLPPEAARRLAAAFLPAETEITDEMVRDVAGELCNVIAGQAKTILKDTPHHFKLSIPTVTLYEQQMQIRGTPIAMAIDGEQILLYVALEDDPLV